MQALPEEIYSVAAVRQIDRAAIEDEGIAGYELMTRAGREAVAAARYRFPGSKQWHVICGAGNNAGDGYVLARLAAQAGIGVALTTLVDPQKLSADAAIAYRDFTEAGGRAEAWSGKIGGTDLLIDAVLGSGLEREVDGDFASAVETINSHVAPVLALDIPTGLHGDTGMPLGVAVVADATITFVGLKAGLFTGRGPEFVGELMFAGLDIPERCRNPGLSVLRRTSARMLDEQLRPRPRVAHKGDFGHVVVIGGGPGMPGAIRLCGEAALRSGAGRVSLATDASHAATIVTSRPELMSHAIESARDLEPLLDSADVIAFGPGLGRSPWSQKLYERVATDTRPAVWDADALNLLAASGGKADTRIITPHPGEAGRLLGISSAEVQADRTAALAVLRKKYGGVAVLKGAGSLISVSGGAPWICTYGNPGMASPGMGDVLTGIVAALLAQGIEAEYAAAIGVTAHAMAADRAARAGERGLLATDLLAELRGVLNR